MKMSNNASTAEIMDTGINYLIEKMGMVEAERFISTLIREKADYTKWRQRYFADITSDDFQAEAVEYAKENPL